MRLFSVVHVFEQKWVRPCSLICTKKKKNLTYSQKDIKNRAELSKLTKFTYDLWDQRYTLYIA